MAAMRLWITSTSLSKNPKEYTRSHLLGKLWRRAHLEAELTMFMHEHRSVPSCRLVRTPPYCIFLIKNPTSPVGLLPEHGRSVGWTYKLVGYEADEVWLEHSRTGLPGP